jgi:hypothetical protein
MYPCVRLVLHVREQPEQMMLKACTRCEIPLLAMHPGWKSSLAVKQSALMPWPAYTCCHCCGALLWCTCAVLVTGPTELAVVE